MVPIFRISVSCWLQSHIWFHGFRFCPVRNPICKIKYGHWVYWTLCPLPYRDRKVKHEPSLSTPVSSTPWLTVPERPPRLWHYWSPRASWSTCLFTCLPALWVEVSKESPLNQWTDGTDIVWHHLCGCTGITDGLPEKLFCVAQKLSLLTLKSG